MKQLPTHRRAWQREEPQTVREYRSLSHCTLSELFWRDTPVERQFHHKLWRRLHCMAMDYSFIGLHRNHIRNVQRRTAARTAPTGDLQQQPRIHGLHTPPSTPDPVLANLQPCKTQMVESITKKEGQHRYPSFLYLSLTA